MIGVMGENYAYGKGTETTSCGANANPSKLEVNREADLTRRGEGGWRAEGRKGSRARTVEWVEADGVRVIEQIEELDDEVEPPGPTRAVRGEAAERDVLDHPEVDGEEGRRAKGVTRESERSSRQGETEAKTLVGAGQSVDGSAAADGDDWRRFDSSCAPAGLRVMSSVVARPRGSSTLGLRYGAKSLASTRTS
jgi:hypothetical protein